MEHTCSRNFGIKESKKLSLSNLVLFDSFPHNILIDSFITHATMFKSLAIATLITGATAFAPSTFGTRVSTQVNIQYGEYDDKLWDEAAKCDVYGKWDPNSPRSTMNFNPFETFGGNSPDASGIYPGEAFYKDPMRGDVSYALMLEEKAAAEQRAANPKPGDVPGCPGCKN
mmetsp:Transcript_17067/g.20841  ORF Transcript_17067/g.20841 Transcript_17067/m.20841 type:complete len:171 (+) Transcript_17067:456-968(+)